MCDGTFQYPNKSAAPTTLENPLLIVCGNASIKTVYPKAHQYITARFIEVNVDPPETEEEVKEKARIEASSRCTVTLPTARARELIAKSETRVTQMSLPQLKKWRMEQDLKKQEETWKKIEENLQSQDPSYFVDLTDKYNVKEIEERL